MVKNGLLYPIFYLRISRQMFQALTLLKKIYCVVRNSNAVFENVLTDMVFSQVFFCSLEDEILRQKKGDRLMGPSK